MKNLRKSNLFTTCLAMLVSFSVIGFVGCEKDLFSTQNDIIGESKEFEDYVLAHYEFSIELQSLNNSKERIGQVNGKSVYRKASKNVDTNLFSTVRIARNKLLEKYPEYLRIGIEDKHLILEKALSKSTKLCHIIPSEVKSPTIRLKSANIEGDDALGLPGYFTEWFGSYEEAYDACANFSNTANVESGGYIFPNGLALLVVDYLATDTSMTIPVWNNGASGIFHFHPGDDAEAIMSLTDSLAVEALLEFGVDSIIIITKDTIRGYGF